MSDSEPSPLPVHCPICHQLIGTYHKEGSEVWLEIGGVILYAAHGKCSRCNTEFHFWASERIELAKCKK
jgi:hypothetical protein